MKGVGSISQLKRSHAEKLPLKLRIIQGILFAAALISMSAWVFTDFNLGNFSLAWLSVILGLVVGFLVELFLEKRIPVLAKFEKLKKSRISIYIAAICMDLTPVALQQFNKAFYNSQPTCEDYVIMEKSGRGGTRYSSGYKIVLLIENSKETIDCEENFWRPLSVGKKVKLCKAKGALGFSYIKSMEAD